MPSIASSPVKSSEIGTISGGSLTIRGSPSTIRVSFLNAARLSLVRAFASLRSARLTTFELTSLDMRAKMSSMSMREYQRSSVRVEANAAIASR